jgi:exodeoxyribonuclease VII small subunit
MSFEEALSRLESIVRTLEVGDVKLEEALKCFEEGTELSKKCLSDLDKIQKRLEMLKVVDGKVMRVPFDESGGKAAPSMSKEEE